MRYLVKKIKIKSTNLLLKIDEQEKEVKQTFMKQLDDRSYLFLKGTVLLIIHYMYVCTMHILIYVIAGDQRPVDRGENSYLPNLEAT